MRVIASASKILDFRDVLSLCYSEFLNGFTIIGRFPGHEVESNRILENSFNKSL